MDGINLLLILSALLTAAFVTSVSIPVIIAVARLKGLMDPPEGRKIHTVQIPTLGGVAMFLGILMGYSLWLRDHMPHYFPYLMAALVVLFTVGIKDDILVIDPMKKFLGQVLAALLVIMGSGLTLTRLDGFMGVHTAPPLVAVLLAVLVFVAIINAYNLIDGVDGLASTLALVAVAGFGTWFFVNGFMAEAILAGVLAGALIGFLIHNTSPATIFMGDTGSLIIGFLVAFLALRMIALDSQAPVLALDKPTLFAFSLMIIPMFDTLRLFAVRMANKKSPFHPDRSHIHHCLLSLGLCHRGVSYVLAAATVVIATISFHINHLEIHLYLVLLMAMAAMVIPVVWLISRISRQGLKDLFERQSLMTTLVSPFFREPIHRPVVLSAHGMPAPPARPDLIRSLDPALFRGTPMEALDPVRSRLFIINRVFMLGSAAQMQLVIGHYGRQEVGEVLMGLPHLEPRVHQMAALLFDVPPEQFKCAQKKAAEKVVDEPV